MGSLLLGSDAHELAGPSLQFVYTWTICCFKNSDRVFVILARPRPPPHFMTHDPSASSLQSPLTAQRRWLAGGSLLAGTSLAASSAFAGVVQIDLLDNFFTNGSGGNQLDQDLTGDGIDDLANLAGAVVPNNVPNTTFGGNYNSLKVQVASGSNVLGLALFKQGITGGVPFKQFIAGNAFLGSSFGQPRFKFANINSATVNEFPALQEHTGLIPITFTDSRINRGAVTNALVEVRSFNVSSTEHTVELVRLVFDDASTVQPTGVTRGGTNNDWIDPTPARLAKIAALQKEIAGLKKKLKAFKKAGSKSKVASTTKKIKKLEAELSLL
jgi:hypothetical protein